MAQAARRSPPTAGVPSSRLGPSMWISLWTKRGLGRFFTGFLQFSPTTNSWRKQLGARLPLLGSRVRISVPPCGFRGGWNGVWVGFSRGFSHFPLPQISFHYFSTLISSISFHFICPCDCASGVVGRHPCYSRTYNIGASSHLIPRPDLVLDTSWGYLFIYNPGISLVTLIC